VLLSAGFLRRGDDFLAQRRPTYVIADPVVRFHELITRRREAMARVWTATRASAPGRRKVIQVIGEAKGTAEARTVEDLARLDGVRRQLEGRGVPFSPTARLLVFSLAGFTDGLAALARSRPDVELVDLARLYQGS